MNKIKSPPMWSVCSSSTGERQEPSKPAHRPEGCFFVLITPLFTPSSRYTFFILAFEILEAQGVKYCPGVTQ